MNERTERQLLELIAAHQAGDPRAADRIVGIVDETVRAIARHYFFPGAEHDDVVQWGYLGVIGGIRTFRPELHDHDVHGFLMMCAKRWIITGLKYHRRHKFRGLNDSVSLDTPANRVACDFDERFLLGDMLTNGEEPSDLIDRRDELQQLVGLINTELTVKERDSLMRVVNGTCYAGEKTVDNAVQRARRKLRLAMAA